MAKQRANGLSVIVFIILRAIGEYTSQILGTPLPDNYKISLPCSDTDRDAIRFYDHRDLNQMTPRRFRRGVPES
jgi:hypothetical protein